MAEAMERYPVGVCGYCIMGNHWHMLVRPKEDGVLSDFMRWVTLTHTHRWHGAHETMGIGHLYQGRFKSFPVQGDAHYLTVLRYIEANPLRAGLVREADRRQWSSLAARDGRELPFELSDGPVELPKGWGQLVQEKLPEERLEVLRNCVNRGAPLGDERWIKQTAVKLNLESTMRPQGRPWKTE